MNIGIPGVIWTVHLGLCTWDSEYRGDSDRSPWFLALLSPYTKGIRTTHTGFGSFESLYKAYSDHSPRFYHFRVLIQELFGQHGLGIFTWESEYKGDSDYPHRFSTSQSEYRVYSNITYKNSPWEIFYA